MQPNVDLTWPTSPTEATDLAKRAAAQLLVCALTFGLGYLARFASQRAGARGVTIGTQEDNQ